MPNAYLMAAGDALRLRPLTNDFPKCLLPVHGKPMLEWWLDAMFECDVFDRVSVNLHHCAKRVDGWLASYMIRKNRIVETIDESGRLLGTAGTLHWHGDEDSEFVVAYVDTFSEFVFFKRGLADLIHRWRQQPEEILAGILCMALQNDSSGAAVRIDKFMNVVGFEEKSSRGDLTWAGVMIARPEFYNYIQDGDMDIARDVLPRLTGKIRVLNHIDAYDIGRGPEHYAELNKRFREAARGQA